MKRIWKHLLFLCAALTLLCVSALAADSVQGIADVKSDVEGVTIKAVDASGNDVTGMTEGDRTVYDGTEKVRVTYSSASANSYYLVLTLNNGDAALAEESVVPTEENIVYIDQVTADGTSVSFDVYPASLSSDTTYNVYLSSSADSGITTLTEVGSFGYYGAAYTLGDVNNDGSINVNDAIAIINHIVARSILTDSSLEAAKVTGAATVKVNDAMEIINYIVGRPQYLGKNDG